MKEPRVGGCQCGALRYSVVGAPIALSVCHCSECQRQSGSAFGMSLTLPRDAFRVTSGEVRTFERKADSGNTVRCSFCPDCGTRIYHEPSAMAGSVNVKAGTLDDTSWLEPVLHAWTGNKQPWVVIPEGVRCFDEQP